MQRENAIEKSKNAIQMRVQVRVRARKHGSVANSMGELQTLINCIHNQHRFGIPDEYFVETCISTSTHNGFVTKEFVKIDEDSQTRDYTIIYIKFQGQTPPFTTLNQNIFDRVLPRPFPQVGDILSEEEDSESEPELIA